MKLGNKGFAFSTMLYGTLALILIILMLLFGVLKSSKDESYYYASIIENNLNKCVDEEVALENCYTSGSSNCDPTSYYACMGISGDPSGTKGIIIAEKLKESIVTSGNGLYQDNVDVKRYVYRGSSVNNYIKYAGLTWRIIAIEADGSIKAGYIGYVDKVKWDDKNADEWKSSTINNFLSTEFYSSLTDTSSLTNKIWHTGRIYNVSPMTLNELKEQENNSEYSAKTGNEGYVGLPNASDYIKASLDANCTSNVLASTSCTSWLASYTSWTMNSDGDVEEGNTQKAYLFQSNSLKSVSVDTDSNILPVVFLKRTLVITEGDGTPSNPYIVS